MGNVKDMRMVERFGRRKPLVFLSILFTALLFYSEPLQDSLRNYKQLCGGPCLSSFSNWDPQAKYLVNTDGCKIANMDPFHESVQKFIKPKKLRDCATPLVKLVNQTLIFDKEVAKSWKYKGAKCCYKKISRIQQNPKKYNKNADYEVKADSKCIEISTGRNGTVVSDHYVGIECINELNVTVFKEFQAVVIPPGKFTNETKLKASFWKERKSNGRDERPPNVLVVGVDSISRLHMMRSLPKTRDFLYKNDFIEMKGYTKMGENTFPNMMAALGGMAPDAWGRCWKGRYANIDDCPFVWKNFSDHNYVTAFLEDAPGLAIFNYDKTGFVVPPTDYYLRPIMVANHQHHKFGQFSASVSCMMGQDPSIYMMNYIRQFILHVGSVNPYFLFSWFTSAGHDDFNLLKPTDKEFEKVLEEAVNVGGDNTVILFISDHGFRFGAFRETFLGFYEESLPFFFIRLPKRLKQRYPEWYSNLRLNSERLTTPLDLYHAFVDILSLSKSQNKTLPDVSKAKEEAVENSKLKNETSLFEPSPLNRTCEVSKIPQKYCMCGVTSQITTKSENMKKMGEFIIEKLNSDLETLIQSGVCVSLKMSKLLYTREVGEGEIWNNFGKLETHKDYLLALDTTPGEGKFEVKVRVFGNGTQVILGDVGRINSYEGKSDCITDYLMKNYCMCKSILDKEAKAKEEKAKEEKKKKMEKVQKVEEAKWEKKHKEEQKKREERQKKKS